MSTSGRPSYIELGVPDRDAAMSFYGVLLGWPEPGPGEMAEITSDTLDIGVHSEDPGAHFEVFFEVDDIVASLEQVVSLGGTVVGEAQEAPGFGTFAECVDDQCVRFGLRQLP